MDVVIALIIIIVLVVIVAKKINKAKPIEGHQDEKNQQIKQSDFSIVLSQCENLNINQEPEKVGLDVVDILTKNGYKQGDLTGYDSEKLRMAITRAYLKKDTTPPRDITLMYSTLLIPKKEIVYFAFEKLGVYSTKRIREFKAGSRGVSFRVAKGVSFRVGNSRGEFITNEKNVYLGSAEVAVTSAGIRIRIETKAKLIKFEKIVSVVKGSETDLIVLTDGERSAPLRFSGEPYQINFLNEMLQEAAN